VIEKEISRIQKRKIIEKGKIKPTIDNTPSNNVLYGFSVEYNFIKKIPKFIIHIMVMERYKKNIKIKIIFVLFW